METPWTFWFGFNLAVLVLLFLDLVVLDRARRGPSMTESIVTTLVWVALALGFGAWLVMREGWGKGSEFFTGYVIEYSLSVDNLFLFVLIFSNFRVTAEQQRRLLFWGVIGALIMRGAMIGAGTALLMRFDWITYVFGAYIFYAGINMLAHKPAKEVEKMRIVRVARQVLPLARGDHGGRFFAWESGGYRFTMLFLVLIVIEITDLVFALDSIPAIFGVTRDPFIVYTSNVCAVLGLRSLYFVLARLVTSLVYLHVGLACILMFIGAKMLGEEVCPVPTYISLLIVGGILGVAIVASLIKSRGRLD
ncbi:MAG TPA: TerC/Alx family metal homeostasis membrane protein [Candidatus Methylacidiphilales bacterium]|jgi:tellurite resistance protein TerC|nr:TerC/Alx family metal homeostasis membrane protein [Candidatus Methylacidiphilales bacterium]